VLVSSESIRRWCRLFGTDFAAKMRKQRPRPGDTWHMDQIYLKINGGRFYLWRAVDQHGVLLDMLMQGGATPWPPNACFADLKYKPRKIVTDELRSYDVARREVLPCVRHRTSRYLNHRAEKSHRPSRRRERQMQRFKSPGQAQRLLSAHAMIYGHFHPRRHLMTAKQYRRSHERLSRSCGRRRVPEWRREITQAPPETPQYREHDPLPSVTAHRHTLLAATSR
jgi:putative transposase